MLSKDEILKRTDNGLDVFKHYIPGQWRVGRNFHNPLYEDRKASCNIYFDRRNGAYRLKDFGNDDYSGDCFDIVGKINGLICGSPKDFIEILKTINRDLYLGLNEGDYSFDAPLQTKPVQRVEKPVQPEKNEQPKQPEAPKKAKPYSIVQQSFSTKETSFWNEYGITPETLKNYKVFSLKEFKSENNDGKSFSFHWTDAEPMFGYVGNRFVHDVECEQTYIAAV
jgi:hypothetical protein